MRKFRLSFKIGDDREFVPALCANATPDELHPKEFEARVRCEVRYDYLPDTVVHRLMVDCAERLNFKKCWLKGLCVDERDACGLVAVCDMGKDDDVLLIDVYQVEGDNKDVKPQSPQSLLRTLLNKLDKINDDLNLKATTWICSNKDPKASFQLSALLEAREQGETSVQFMADGHFKRYNIDELLGQVFDEPIKVAVSTSDKGEIELNFDGVAPQYSFLKSIWTVLKPLMEKSMEKTPNEKVGNSIVVNLIGNGNSAVVGSDSSSAKSEIRVVQSDSGLQKQLDEFRNELNKLVELNEGQKQLLYDAIGELIDHLDEPKEKQKSWKDKLNNTIKVTGDLLGLASKFATVAAQFGLSFPL